MPKQPRKRNPAPPTGYLTRKEVQTDRLDEAFSHQGGKKKKDGDRKDGKAASISVPKTKPTAESL